jgi:hypothetical protein
MKFLTFFLFVSSLSFAQVNIMWEARFDNANAVDQSRDIALDANGNILVTGDSFDGVSFNIVTIKYDPLGNQIWSQEFDGAGNGLDQASKLALDSNGDVIVTGYTYTGTGSDYDIITIKYNGLTGAVLWTRIFTGTANFDIGRYVTIDGLNNVIVTGQLEPGLGNNEMITIKYDNAGTLLWSNTYSNGTSSFDAGFVNAIDASNNIYMVGYSEGGANETDFLIRKYNPAGAIQWTRRYDNNNGPEEPTSAIFDAENNSLTVVGSTFTNVSNKVDFWVLNLDAVTGNLVWSDIYNGTASDDDIANAVDTDGLGNTYVTGRSKGIGTNFDYVTIKYTNTGAREWVRRFDIPGNGLDNPVDIKVRDNFEVYVTGYSFDANSNNDYLTIRYDENGNVMWSTRFDGPASDVDNASKMVLDNDGNIFVTGNSRGTGTNWDYCTIKYCQLQTIASSNDLEICIGQSAQLQGAGGFNFQWTLVSGDPITAANFSCTACANPIATPTVTSTYLVTSENAAGCVDSDSITIVVNPLPGPVISTNGPTEFCNGGSVTLTADFAPSYNWSNGSTTQSISTNTSGVFILTITDAMGCQNSTSVEVTVNPLPVVNGGPDRFRCPGVGLTLNGSGADSLAWYRIPTPSNVIANGTTITPTTSGSYLVVGIDQNGCVNRDTIQVTIYPFPSQIELTQGMSGNLFVNLNDGTTNWFLDGNSLNHSGTSFFYDSVPYCNGLYSVVYTDENGCQTTDQLAITDACQDTIDTTINVQQFYQESFSIFPNPTVGEVTIQFESLKQRTILIQNTQGKLVHTSEAIDDNYFVDLSLLAKGTYMIVILSEDGVTRARVIKQ